MGVTKSKWQCSPFGKLRDSKGKVILFEAQGTSFEGPKGSRETLEALSLGEARCPTHVPPPGRKERGTRLDIA